MLTNPKPISLTICFLKLGKIHWKNITQEGEHGVFHGVIVTQFPSWPPAALAKPFSAATRGSQAVLLWPEREIPHTGSRRVHSPPLGLGATLHFRLTRGWRPGGGVWQKSKLYH